MKTLVALLLASTLPSIAIAAPERLTIRIDGVDRQALVFAPTKGAAAVPTLFVYHGAGDTAENFTVVGLHEAWPEALVVYMDGLSRGPGEGGVFQARDASNENRDLKFFDAMLADLHKRFTIDDTRVYATGFSNGARMVYLFWATRPKVFAAFAPVAGMLSADTALMEPKPVFHVGGRADRTNAFDEQMKSVELARAANRATGTPVETYIHNGGHYWPPDTTARIVAFLRTRTLPR
ncbi:MAG: prolyl oligopeptidase family serine peptidase [Steroidobacteraceae bacterium]